MGSYINKNLLNGETVIFETKYHWIIFLKMSSFLTLFIRPILKMKFDEFVITNKRVVVKTGIIKRETLELLNNKIEAINVNQGIMGRLFNYGTIIICGTGGTKSAFPRISNPIEFRKAFQNTLS
ncbi:MAG: PH domain-containing protein [Sphingobacteriia bacterium]|jgi:uncharacterized membrane protein YdbT with pleckstrin-like domain|nr:PH domain-containing protein [Paludibacteraceae bacterium]NCA80016.1 PH domain-containing protein [Sphingobacteriia bacterium]